MDDDHASMSCCAPARSGLAIGPGRDREAASPLTPVSGRHDIEQCRIPAQEFVMGDALGDGNPGDGEWPLHRVSLDAFDIDATTVTNADFDRFVFETDYRTEAETFGYSAVFHLAIRAAADEITGRASGTPWWVGVRGADWRHPGGTLSSVEGLLDHPAVHISWNDAVAYCVWAGRRLATEAEWECASRGGLSEKRYPWGDELGDRWQCNIWQGQFPTVNTRDDGWLTTAPVRTYQPNGYGLWQTVGNVWEWCSDWWSPTYYAETRVVAPIGPADGTMRNLRGGSFLCHDSYCNRYRNAARSSNTPDSSMGNAGFRTVGLAS